MAKIDLSAIDGYSDMSAEDKVKALEGFEFDDRSEQLAKLRKSVDNATHEAAEYKRQLKDAEVRQTEGKSDAEKQLEDMKRQIETMRREKTISDYSARLVSQGYDAELASASSKALADGNMDEFFSNAAKFLSDHDTKLKAQLAKHSIEPKTGNSNPDSATQMTKQRLMKLPAGQRAAFAEHHPDEFREIMGL